MGPNARAQRTVTPVQRSNGVSPTPNPRGVEGRDLLLCPPVLGSRTEHIPPLVSLCRLVGGYYWAANSAPGGASRRPCRELNMIKSYAHDWLLLVRCLSRLRAVVRVRGLNNFRGHFFRPGHTCFGLRDRGGHRAVSAPGSASGAPPQASEANWGANRGIFSFIFTAKRVPKNAASKGEVSVLRRGR